MGSNYQTIFYLCIHTLDAFQSKTAVGRLNYSLRTYCA